MMLTGASDQELSDWEIFLYTGELIAEQLAGLIRNQVPLCQKGVNNTNRHYSLQRFEFYFEIKSWTSD